MSSTERDEKKTYKVLRITVRGDEEALKTTSKGIDVLLTGHLALGILDSFNIEDLTRTLTEEDV